VSRKAKCSSLIGQGRGLAGMHYRGQRAKEEQVALADAAQHLGCRSIGVRMQMVEGHVARAAPVVPVSPLVLEYGPVFGSTPARAGKGTNRSLSLVHPRWPQLYSGDVPVSPIGRTAVRRKEKRDTRGAQRR
jgi:hypothetical protein